MLQREFSGNFEQDQPSELCTKLRRFYGEVQTKDGKPYSKSALIGLRAGLNRHMQSPPFNRTLNITTDVDFLPANKILTGKIRSNRAEGNDITQHKKSISKGDINKMYSSGVLNDSNPQALQNKVFFELSFHFCRRGAEGLDKLKKTDFIFIKDDSDMLTEYVTIKHNETTKKNHGTEASTNKDQRMYSRPGDPNCPIGSLKKYLSKLHPQEDSFFQHARRCSLDVLKEENAHWYARKMGAGPLGKMMKNISKEAQLSHDYTNHCIRATTATVLAHAEIEHSDIISVTGHKDIKSLEPYVTSVSNDKRKKMSNILHQYGNVNGNQIMQIQNKPEVNVKQDVNACVNTSQNLGGIFVNTPIYGGQFTINYNQNE